LTPLTGRFPLRNYSINDPLKAFIGAVVFYFAEQNYLPVNYKTSSLLVL